MKTIGMLGGMSWESTQSYYRAINEGVKQRLGGLHSAKILLYSADFAEIETLQREGKWTEAGELLGQVAANLERAGADFLMLCTNTMHQIAPAIEARVKVPLLHIADATAAALQRDKVSCIGLLGTRFTMELPFYRDLLEAQGIDVRIPDEAARQAIDGVIFQELCRGEIRDQSRDTFLDVIEKLHGQGAQAIVLGCTEIALLVQQGHTPIPLYDTAAIHAEQAVEWALR